MTLAIIFRRLFNTRQSTLSNLSEWEKSVRSLIQIIINKTQWVYEPSLALHQTLKTQILLNTCLSFVTDTLLPPPTRPLTILFLCVHHIDLLIKELGIDNSFRNPTYIPTIHTKEKILDNHRSVLCSFGIATKDEELDLPLLYWIPKLHKWPFKHRYIAVSDKCSTKPLSKLLTCILSAVKTGLQSYSDTSYSRGGVN